ncbi:MAG TPA: pilus assembly protein PilM [Chitinispirillaceae bacterium]|nr:pilus assembly protein PilM [Chitinispirillaceae bacterium]
MKNNSQFINGLDIQKEYLSIVQYSPSEKAVVLVAIQPMASGDADTIWDRTARALLELKTKFKFSSPEIICSIPADYAFVKRLAVDATISTSEEMLEWEMSQHLLGSLDDYVVDFQKDGIFGQQEQMEYLAVAYRKENLNRVLSALKTLKLKPAVIDIDLFAIANVFESNYRDQFTDPVMLVHAESGKTKVLLTQSGQFIDTHIFECENGQNDPALYADRFAKEINGFAQYNTSRLLKSPALYFTGSLFGAQSFADAVVARIGYGELLNPFREIGCRVGTEDNQIMAYAAQLSVAVGLALRGYE